MQIHKDCFYTEIIKRCFPDANNLHKPKITGWVSPAVFIINTNNQIRVCKFNNKAIVLHNKYICDLLISHDIQIPKTTVHNIGNTWFESYVFYDVATKSGSKITVNYTSATSSLVDKMIATKSSNSNVVKGVQVD